LRRCFGLHVLLILVLAHGLGPKALRAAEVSAPDTLVRYGTALEMPIRLSGGAGDIVAIELTLAYDSQVASLDCVIVGGTPIEGWVLDTLRTVGGLDTIKVVAATAADTILADGTVLLLAFQVTDTRAVASTPLNIAHALLNAGTPAATVMDGSITIVGEDGAIDATVVVQPGDTVRVRVADDDLSLDSGSAESIVLPLLNARSGETGSVTLDETGVDTGTFFGQYYTESGGPEADGDDIFTVIKGDSLRAHYTDALNGSGTMDALVGLTQTAEPLGDASGNGTVRGFDAALILDHSVGSLTLTGIDSLSANLDSLAPTSAINAFDASLVLQQRVGLLGRFPVQLPDADNHPQPETGAAPRRLARDRVLTLHPLGAGGFVLSAPAGEAMLSGDLVLSRFEGRVAAGAALAQALLAQHPDRYGNLRVAFATASPVAEGVLLHLTPRDGAAPRFERLLLNNGDLIGQVQRHDEVAVPRRFALHPATPNPFNPGTTIAYELERATSVRLQIVNLLGQPVRVLVDGERLAGYHVAVWDGTDDRGRAVGGGVYFHRLTAGSYSATGKMTLAR
jgi:hypothetical protein